MKRILTLAIIFALLAAGCGKEPKTFDELAKAGKKAYIKDDFAKARDYLGKAVTLNPSERSSLYFLAMAYERDGMDDSAYYYMGRADVLFPGDREINQAMYTISQHLQDWAGMRKAIGVLIQTGDPASAYNVELARLNLADSNYTIAYRYYRMALKDSLDVPSRWLDVANSAAQIDSVDVAIDVIDSAIAKFGSRPEFLLNKGLYLSGKRDYPAAEKVFRSLMESDTSQVAFKLNLAHTLAAQDSRKKKEEALSLYQELKDVVGPEFGLDSLIVQLSNELGKS